MLAAAPACAEAAADDRPNSLDPVEGARYLVRISGCNDCHAEGYARSRGEIP